VNGEFTVHLLLLFTDLVDGRITWHRCMLRHTAETWELPSCCSTESVKSTPVRSYVASLHSIS